jgi:hypothetical protein
MEMTERPYTLRRLKDKDLWPILDIIGKVFPGDLSSMFAQIMTGGKDLEAVGAEVVMKLVMAVIRNMDKVEEEVYDLLADVSGIRADDIKEMAFGTTPMMILDIVKNEKNADFFVAVSKSF